MGNSYKPAKPGDKDYPKQDALKKAQAEEEEWDGVTYWKQEELLKIWPELAKADDIPVDEDEEEMKYHSEDNAEMAVIQLSSTVDKLNQLIEAIRNKPDVALEISEPWITGKIALIEDYSNAIHSYLMYPKEGLTGALFEPPLQLNPHNQKMVDQAYKTIVEPSFEKEHGEKRGAFTEDDMEYQQEYQKTVHPDYPAKNMITKDKIFTKEELNKDLKEYPGNSKR